MNAQLNKLTADLEECRSLVQEKESLLVRTADKIEELRADRDGCLVQIDQIRQTTAQLEARNAKVSVLHISSGAPQQEMTPCCIRKLLQEKSAAEESGQLVRSELLALSEAKETREQDHAQTLQELCCQL